MFWRYVLVSCSFGCVRGKAVWLVDRYFYIVAAGNATGNQIECGGHQQGVSMFAALFAVIESCESSSYPSAHVTCVELHAEEVTVC
jgi:hypothetical protein